MCKSRCSVSCLLNFSLQEVKQKVSETEGRVHQLAQEVCELRRRAKRQRQEQASRQRVPEQALNTNNNAGGLMGCSHPEYNPDIIPMEIYECTI